MKMSSGKLKPTSYDLERLAQTTAHNNYETTEVVLETLTSCYGFIYEWIGYKSKFKSVRMNSFWTFPSTHFLS